ncbi:hypothetical protein PG984_013509 [Apiospora sp. TS-2023a]
MQFSLALLALAGAAAAKAIPPTNPDWRTDAIPRGNESAIADVGTEAITHLYVCINSNFGGACTNIQVNTGDCFSISGNFNDAITSLGPDQGTTCTIWQDSGCSGRSLGGIVAPGIYNLDDYNFNDISTYD